MSQRASDSAEYSEHSVLPLQDRELSLLRLMQDAGECSTERRQDDCSFDSEDSPLPSPREQALSTAEKVLQKYRSAPSLAPSIEAAIQALIDAPKSRNVDWRGGNAVFESLLTGSVNSARAQLLLKVLSMHARDPLAVPKLEHIAKWTVSEIQTCLRVMEHGRNVAGGLEGRVEGTVVDRLRQAVQEELRTDNLSTSRVGKLDDMLNAIEKLEFRRVDAVANTRQVELLIDMMRATGRFSDDVTPFERLVGASQQTLQFASERLRESTTTLSQARLPAAVDPVIELCKRDSGAVFIPCAAESPARRLDIAGVVVHRDGNVSIVKCDGSCSSLELSVLPSSWFPSFDNRASILESLGRTGRGAGDANIEGATRETLEALSSKARAEAAKALVNGAANDAIHNMLRHALPIEGRASTLNASVAQSADGRRYREFRLPTGGVSEFSGVAGDALVRGSVDSIKLFADGTVEVCMKGTIVRENGEPAALTWTQKWSDLGAFASLLEASARHNPDPRLRSRMLEMATAMRASRQTESDVLKMDHPSVVAISAVVKSAELRVVAGMQEQIRANHSLEITEAEALHELRAAGADSAVALDTIRKTVRELGTTASSARTWAEVRGTLAVRATLCRYGRFPSLAECLEVYRLQCTDGPSQVEAQNPRSAGHRIATLLQVVEHRQTNSILAGMSDAEAISVMDRTNQLMEADAGIRAYRAGLSPFKRTQFDIFCQRSDFVNAALLEHLFQNPEREALTLGLRLETLRRDRLIENPLQETISLHRQLAAQGLKMESKRSLGLVVDALHLRSLCPELSSAKAYELSLLADRIRSLHYLPDYVAFNTVILQHQKGFPLDVALQVARELYGNHGENAGLTTAQALETRARRKLLESLTEQPEASGHGRDRPVSGEPTFLKGAKPVPVNTIGSGIDPASQLANKSIQEIAKQVSSDLRKLGLTPEQAGGDFVKTCFLEKLNEYSELSSDARSRVAEVVSAHCGSDTSMLKQLFAEGGPTRSAEARVGTSGLTSGSRSVFDSKRLCESLARLGSEMNQNPSTDVGLQELFAKVRDVAKYEGEPTFRDALNQLELVRSKDGASSLFVLHKNNEIKVLSTDGQFFVTLESGKVPIADCKFRLSIGASQNKFEQIARGLGTLELILQKTPMQDWQSVQDARSTAQDRIDRRLTELMERSELRAQLGVPLELVPDNSVASERAASVVLGERSYGFLELIDTSIRQRRQESIHLSTDRWIESQSEIRFLEQLRDRVAQKDATAIADLHLYLRLVIEKGHVPAARRAGVVKDSRLSLERASGRAAAYLIVGTTVADLILRMRSQSRELPQNPSK